MRNVVFILAAEIIMNTSSLQPAPAQSYPQITNLSPFTPASNFMSVPGYLRWQYYLASGRWVSRETALSAIDIEREWQQRKTK